MRKARILLVLGIWVAVLPYLGFPNTWKNILFTVSGLGLIYFSYLSYKTYRVDLPGEEKTFENFSENQGSAEENKGVSVDTESDMGENLEDEEDYSRFDKARGKEM